MRLILEITQSEALERLKENVNTEKEPEALLFGFGWHLEEIMYGKFNGNNFWIYDRGAFELTKKAPTSVRQITGSIDEENGKAVVDYKFGYTMYNYGFFLAIYVILFVLSAMKGASAIALLIMTAFFAAVVLIVLGSATLFGQGYKTRALTHFRDVFADCIETSYDGKN